MMNQTGRINVTDGGQLHTSAAIHLGRQMGSYATLSVDDGEVDCDARIFVGYVQGSGTLNVLGDGQLTAVGIDAGPMMTGSGLVNVDGGWVDVLDIAIASAGSVHLKSGGIEADTITDTFGNFNWTGGELNVDLFQGDLHNKGGALVIGHSPGLAKVTGNYTQDNGGMLLVELFGTDSSEYDRLHVDGTLTLGGTLDVFVEATLETNLQPGDSFDILDWGTLTAGKTFDTVNLHDLSPMRPDLAWDDSQLYTDGIIRVTPEPNALLLLLAASLAFTIRPRQGSVE